MKYLTDPRYRQMVRYQAILLGGFTLLATTLLVVANRSTREVIALREQEDLLQSLNQVIPAESYDGSLLDHPLTLNVPNHPPITLYRGLKQQRVSVVAFTLSGQGYAGEIRLLLGLKANGEILGVRVLAHNETPGLGDKIEVQRDPWITRFNGLSLTNTAAEQWQVKKDGGQFDAFSGATITPRAVVKTVYSGLAIFAAEQSRILDLTPTPTAAAGAEP